MTRSILASLSQVERTRALRFHFERDRIAFSCAHLLLRRCLEHFTGRADWSFAKGLYGKPTLAPGLISSVFDFNISHTPGRVVCAMSFGHEVGVDIETSNITFDFLDIAKNYFSYREQHTLQRLSKAESVTAFCSIWTLKEAVTKALGFGLQMPLNQFTVCLTPPSVCFEPALAEDEKRWRLACRHVEGAWLAVAVRSPVGAPGPDRFRWYRTDYETLLRPGPEGWAPGILVS